MESPGSDQRLLEVVDSVADSPAVAVGRTDQFAYGAPTSTPPLAEVWDAWHAITRAADPWLDDLTSADLVQPRAFMVDGQTLDFTFGNLLQRVIYHYWYHTGENLAIRQQLGHTDLPEFVGNIDDEAPYRLE